MNVQIINKISQAISLIEDRLKEGVAELRQQDKVGVEKLSSLDGYLLKHPRGVLGLLYNGSNYSRRDDVKNNLVYMKKDVLVGVVAIIRYLDDPLLPASGNLMLPCDYTEFIEDTIAGIEILNGRPEYERKIFPVSTELIDEDKGIWKYLTIFSIPVDFIEKQFR